MLENEQALLETAFCGTWLSRETILETKLATWARCLKLILKNLRQENHYDCKASLGFIRTSRPVWYTESVIEGISHRAPGRELS